MLQRTRVRTGFVLPVGGSIEHLVYHPNKQPALLQHAEDQETGRSLFHVQLLNPPLILPSQAPSHKPFCLHSHYHGTQSSLLTAAQMPASPGLVPAPPAVTHGVGTLRAISMTKPPAKDPRRFTMEEGFGPGTCPTRCLRQHLRDSAKVRREFPLRKFKDK